jgi:hypothetical protein
MIQNHRASTREDKGSRNASADDRVTMNLNFSVDSRLRGNDSDMARTEK